MGPTCYSLEAKHLILVWIMKVKGPKNQANFIEELYVVVNAWCAGPYLLDLLDLFAWV